MAQSGQKLPIRFKVFKQSEWPKMEHVAQSAKKYGLFTVDGNFLLFFWGHLALFLQLAMILDIQSYAKK